MAFEGGLAVDVEEGGCARTGAAVAALPDCDASLMLLALLRVPLPSLALSAAVA